MLLIFREFMGFFQNGFTVLFIDHEGYLLYESFKFIIE